MASVAELSVAAESFALGRCFRIDVDGHFEFRRIVPVDDGPLPLCWYHGSSPDVVESTLRDRHVIDDLTRLATHEGRTLFQLEWSHVQDELVTVLERIDASVLNVRASYDEWVLVVLFLDSESMGAFYSHCRANGIVFDVHRLNTPGTVHSGESLSEKQFEALRAAFRLGYFEVPREITLTELAEELDLSDQAVSQRLRRGLATHLQESLFGDPDG